MATGLRRKRIYFFPYFSPCLTLSRLLSPWCHWCTSHPPSISIAFYPSYFFLFLFSSSYFLYFSTLLVSLYVHLYLYIYVFPWFRYIFPFVPVFSFICSSNLLFPFSISLHSFVFCFHLVLYFGFSSVSSILSFPFLILSNLSVHYIRRK